MNEQIQARKPWQRRPVGPTIFMVVGIIFLVAIIFIFATGVGTMHGLGGTAIFYPHGGFMGSVPTPLFDLRALTVPGIPVGVTLFLIGLVNTTKKPSLRWLRITVRILCGVILGLAVLWFLLTLFLLSLGS